MYPGRIIFWMPSRFVYVYRVLCAVCIYSNAFQGKSDVKLLGTKMHFFYARLTLLGARLFLNGGEFMDVYVLRVNAIMNE